MPLSYQSNGALVPGLHTISLAEFKNEFCYNEEREILYLKMLEPLDQLKCVGCKKVYIDGSFVTKKVIPGDYDLCWDEDGVDTQLLYDKFYSLVDYGFKMRTMRKRYSGDIVPKLAFAKEGITFFYYFQADRNDKPKGIIEINLI